MEKYLTTDFYLAAFLLSQTHGLLACDKGPHGSTFVFEDSNGLRHDAEKYFSRRAAVEPIAYGVAQKSLKGLIHGSTFTAVAPQNYHVKQSQGLAA
jgi:hypothetical protein